MSKACVPYDALRPELDTGDLVLFSGRGLVSATIKLFSRSRWSHVGMVYRVVEHDLVLLWESTTLTKLKDLDTGTARQGVQLVPLQQRLLSYPGEVAVRRLEGPRRAEHLARLQAFRAEVRGRPYETSKLTLLRAALDLGTPLGENHGDLSSLFCSELVIEAYRRAGWAHSQEGGSGVPSDEWEPADFDHDGTIDVALTSGYSLRPPVEVCCG